MNGGIRNVVGCTALTQWARRSKRLLSADDGSALVEFALTLPLLALMLMAGTGTALLIHAQFAVQASSRDAATVGAYVSTSIDPYNRATDAAMESAERVLIDYGLDPQRAVITFGDTSTSLERGSLFYVQIIYSVDLPSPMATWLGRTESEGPTFTVTAMSVVPIQKYKARWPCPSDDPICD